MYFAYFILTSFFAFWNIFLWPFHIFLKWRKWFTGKERWDQNENILTKCVVRYYIIVKINIKNFIVALLLCCKENECCYKRTKTDGEKTLFIIKKFFLWPFFTSLQSVNPYKFPYKYPCYGFLWMYEKNVVLRGMSVASTT